MLNVWLLTWEGMAGPAIDPERKIIAIIDARRSESFVEGLIDVLYSRFVDSAYDTAFMANKRKQRESQYRHLNTDSEPDSVFVITAYELKGKPLLAYRRRRRRKHV